MRYYLIWAYNFLNASMFCALYHWQLLSGSREDWQYSSTYFLCVYPWIKMCMVLYLNKRSIKNVFCQIWLNPVVLEKKMKMRKIYRAGNQESSLEHSAQLKKEFFYMRCCQRWKKNQLSMSAVNCTSREYTECILCCIYTTNVNCKSCDKYANILSIKFSLVLHVALHLDGRGHVFSHGDLTTLSRSVLVLFHRSD